MLKIAFCLRRLPGMSLEEFQGYWLNNHAPLVRQLAPTLRIQRYVQSHSASYPQLAPIITSRGGVVEAYDGVAEIYWESLEEMMVAGASKEGRDASRALLEDERNFIDLPSSPLFFTHEHEIISNFVK
jgi:uncharacterized protein (TIGR02118 family)